MFLMLVKYQTLEASRLCIHSASRERKSKLQSQQCKPAKATKTSSPTYKLGTLKKGKLEPESFAIKLKAHDLTALKYQLEVC